MVRSRRLLALLVSLGLAALVSPPSAGAAPAPETSAKPVVDTDVFEVDGEPTRIVQGPDGNLWFGVQGNSGGNDLARITPSGAITYFELGTTIGTLAVGPDKQLWSTVDTGVARIPTSDPAGRTIFDITGFMAPEGLAVGPDGNLWAAALDTLYRVPLGDPSSATPFTVAGMTAKQVTATSNRIWVADLNGKIHAFTTGGVPTTFDVGGNPQGIVAGPNGQVLYSNPEGGANHAARLQLGGTPQKTPLPNTDPSFSVAFAPDGAYWVGLFLTRQVARITPTGTLTTYGTFPAPYLPRYVANGPGNTIWVSLQDPGMDGAIGRVTGLDVDKKATIKVKGATAPIAKGRATLKLQCPKAEANGPCIGKLTLRSLTGKKAKLGAKTYKARSGKTVKVKVALGRRTLAQIGRQGLKVKAVVTVKDKAGNKATVRKTVRLVR